MTILFWVSTGLAAYFAARTYKWRRETAQCQQRIRVMHRRLQQRDAALALSKIYIK